MNLTCSREVLLSAVKLAAGALERKTSVPILDCLKIETFEHKTVMLHGTDLEVYLTASLTADEVVPGEAVVPAKWFLDSLKAMPKGAEVTLTAERIEHVDSDKPVKVTLTGGGINTSETTFPPDDYPCVPDSPAGATYEYEPGVLADAISPILHAVTQEHSRFALNSGLLVCREKGVIAVSTDGHRMVRQRAGETRIRGEEDKGAHLLVPLKALRILAGIKDGMAVTVPRKKQVQVLFHRPGFLLYARVVEGAFPAYGKVIETEERCQTTVTFEREELFGAIQSLRKVDRRATGLRFLKIELNRAAILSTGKPHCDDQAIATMEVKGFSKEGPDITIGFNTDYLLDMVRASEGKHVIARFHLDKNDKGEEDHGAAHFHDPDNTGYHEVVMPVRL